VQLEQRVDQGLRSLVLDQAPDESDCRRRRGGKGQPPRGELIEVDAVGDHDDAGGIGSQRQEVGAHRRGDRDQSLTSRDDEPTDRLLEGAAEGPHRLAEVLETSGQSRYLDRLRDRRVLESGLLSVMDSLVWEVEGFALASGCDEDAERYTGLVLPGDTVETLHERIKVVERRLYVKTIHEILERGSVQ